MANSASVGGGGRGGHALVATSIGDLPDVPSNGRVAHLRVSTTPYEFITLLYDTTLSKWVSPLVGWHQSETDETTGSTSYVNLTGARLYLPGHKALYDAGLRLQGRMSSQIRNSGGGNTTSMRLNLYELADGDTVPASIATTADPTISHVGTVATYKFSNWLDFSYSGAPGDAHAVVIPQFKASAGTAGAAGTGHRVRWAAAAA